MSALATVVTNHQQFFLSSNQTNSIVLSMQVESQLRVVVDSNQTNRIDGSKISCDSRYNYFTLSLNFKSSIQEHSILEL